MEQPKAGALARLKLYNNALIKSRELLGWAQNEAARRISISPSILSALETLKESPWGTKGLRPNARKVMDFYGLDEATAYPPELYGLTQTTFETFVSPEGVLLLEEQIRERLLPSPEEAMEKVELSEQVEKAFSTLTAREEMILRQHYGFGREEHTLDDIADELDLTRERIRQIEFKALAKLRHPTRRRLVEDWS